MNPGEFRPHIYSPCVRMGDSLLAQPSHPIEMKVFHGGGLPMDGGGASSLLPTPSAPIEMKVFQGGGEENRGEENRGEENRGEETNTRGQWISNARGTRRLKSPPAPLKQDFHILSNGLTVRFVDDSVKGDILTLKFTQDEQTLFDDELHFGHPFIREWLQRDANKEKWFTFWKTFTNFDGTDKFTLMTYQEGQLIQRFKREVYEAYRQYLLEATLPFLLKSQNPHAVKLITNPPEEQKGFLFETVAPSGAVSADDAAAAAPGDASAEAKAPAEATPEAAKDPEAAPRRSPRLQGKANPPTDDSTVGSNEESFNSNEEETNAGTEYSGDTNTTNSSIVTTLSDESTESVGRTMKNFNYNHILNMLYEPASNNTPNILLSEEERIMNVIKQLDEDIPDTPILREYLELQKEVLFPLTDSKLSAKGFFEVLKNIPEKDLTLLVLLRNLVRVDISKFSEPHDFRKFFGKFFNPEGKKKKLYPYIDRPLGGGAALTGGSKKSLRKRIKTTRKKTNPKVARLTSSSRSRVRTSRKARSK